MTSTEVLKLADEFTKATGLDSGDHYDKLIDWLREQKGEQVAKDFAARLASDPL